MSTPHEFEDDEYWVELAKKAKVRLPHRTTPLTTGGMRKFMHKLGLTNEEYLAWTGGQTIKQFTEATVNSHWTLRAFVGICLEHMLTLGKTPPSKAPREKKSTSLAETNPHMADQLARARAVRQSVKSSTAVDA